MPLQSISRHVYMRHLLLSCLIRYTVNVTCLHVHPLDPRSKLIYSAAVYM